MTMNTITGIVAILIGVAYSYLAWDLPRATVGNPMGPIVFPLLLGGGMVLMGGIQLVQTRSKTKGERKNVSLSLTFYGKSIAQVSALCVLYVFLFERLGYLFSTFLFLVTVLFLFNGKGKWKFCTGIGGWILVWGLRPVWECTEHSIAPNARSWVVGRKSWRQFFTNLGIGLQVALQPINLIWVTVGSILGTIIGCSWIRASYRSMRYFFPLHLPWVQ
jgi:putative tricarboxylic transport membrane protein